MEVVDISSDSDETIIVPYTTSIIGEKVYTSTGGDFSWEKHKSKSFYSLSSDEEEIVAKTYDFQWKHHELIDKQLISSELNNSMVTSCSKSNELDAILKKYTSSDSYENNDFHSSSFDKIASSGDDGKEKHFELMDYKDSSVSVCDKDELKELYNKYLPSSIIQDENEKSDLLGISKSSVESTSQLSSSQKSTRNEGVSQKNKNQVKGLSKKQIQEEKRILKQIERDKKKEAKEKEKALKQSVKTIQRSNSKEQCIKNIIVRIGTIIEQDYGETIKSALRENNISTKSDVEFPNLITWIRKIQTLENLLLKETECSDKHCLLIMPFKEFASCVKQRILGNRVQGVLNANFEHITVVIFGTERFTNEQELAIIEIEMTMKCHWEFVKSIEHLATFVYMISKAVAQIPYKLEQAAKLKTQNLYFNDSNKDTVRVDKNGNGLSRLWHQMLTMFPLARLETAEAITAVYPTPSKLFEAYKDCEQKEKLLQDLPIRRAQGPLTTVRKLGPELSKKVCTFFTSTENKML